MKFLLCLVLCFVAAQAGHLGEPSALGYVSPYTTYSAGLPSLYNTPLAYSGYSGYPTTYSGYSGYPTTYSGYSGYPTTYAYGGIPTPSVYRGLDLGAQYLGPSGYAAPSLYSSPSVYPSLLKK